MRTRSSERALSSSPRRDSATPPPLRPSPCSPRDCIGILGRATLVALKGEALTQTPKGLAADLGYPRLGHMEHLGDLPQIQLLVVVHREHGPLFLREHSDRLPEALHVFPIGE